MQHTPGPWQLSGPDRFDNYTIETSDNRKEIAALTIGMSDEQAANARLIAAAPDMLAALEWYVLHDDFGPDDDYHLAGFDRARAALAKARGES